MASRWDLQCRARSSSECSIVGPAIQYQMLFAYGMFTVVNPDRIPGKVTLIGRYGAEKVRDCPKRMSGD